MVKTIEEVRVTGSSVLTDVEVVIMAVVFIFA